MSEVSTPQQMLEQQQLSILTPAERSVAQAVDMAKNGVRQPIAPQQVLGGIVMPNVMRGSD